MLVLRKLVYLVVVYTLFVSVGVSANSAHPEIRSINQINAPDNLDNTHIIKLSSDKYASTFLIFVKKEVTLHKHVKHTETVYVLEGKGLFTLGNDTKEIGPGDYLSIPEGVPHGLKVTSTSPMKALSIQAPEFLGDDRVAIE